MDLVALCVLGALGSPVRYARAELRKISCEGMGELIEESHVVYFLVSPT